MSDGLLPWHEQNWKYLVKRLIGQNIPHALMLQGAQGLGKFRFATQFTQLLLCKNPTEGNNPCGSCNSCILFASNGHPDFMQLTPAEPGKGILVDQVRKISQDLSLKSHSADYKVVIINPAEKMNISASNSLLKTLEEPSADTIIMLITDKPSKLSPTVRSRCQKLVFQKPTRDVAKQWLQKQVSTDLDLELLLSLSGQAPLQALEMSQDSQMHMRRELFQDLTQIIENKVDCVSVAAKWNKNNCIEFLALMSSWVMDMIKLKFNTQKSLIENTDFYPILSNLKNLIEIKSLFKLYDCITKYSNTHNQLNSSLLFEDVLLRWRALKN